ncbi:hypothetical protein F4808DRAFT_92814 [Astrocystis sublimbata]|nr:hypothetical protein F4808DRAFT_92814 [Astrocystis sublimbata]
MGGVNLNISNGLCWSNVNVALEEEYIPCGNVESGNNYACCHYGDNCLSSNACYHERYDITYLAGCTSQDFSAPACQKKGGFYNQPWVGLVRCDPDQTYWAGCQERHNVIGTSPPTNCKCSEDTILFQDKPRLDNIASLPQSLGGTISWFPGHEPTTATSSTTSTRGTSSITISTTGSTPTSTSNTQTPTSSAVVPLSEGLSAGEKAGIGVGSAFGALALICLITIIVILRRRMAGTKEEASSQPRLPTVESNHFHDGRHTPNTPMLSGYKAELPADEPRTASTVPLSPLPVSPISTFSPTPSPSPYQPYRPGRHGDNRYSNVSQMSCVSGAHPYPESVVSAISPRVSQEPLRAAGEHAHLRSGPPDTIPELP